MDKATYWRKAYRNAVLRMAHDRAERIIVEAKDDGVDLLGTDDDVENKSAPAKGKRTAASTTKRKRES